jgi:prophage DNA circulation protein
LARIIEARAILSATDATGGAFKGVVDKINAIAKAQTAFSKSGAKEIGVYTKQVATLNEKLGAIEHFKRQHQALKESRVQFRAAQDDVVRLGRAMRDTANPTREMTREYERAQRTVRASATAFQDKVAAVKAARVEMSGYGVTLANLNRQHSATLRAMNRQPGAQTRVTTRFGSVCSRQ